ncbi:MAG: TIGR01777 family oxidoreductase [Actinomycetota bacterium]
MRPGSAPGTGSAGGPPRTDGGGAIAWDPAAGTIDAASLEGIGAIVNLAGIAVGPHRWTPSYKEQILQTRTRSTRLLAQTIAGLTRPPAVLVNASASGYYGDRGDEILTEESAAGTDFLAEVCVAWEGATQPAQAAGIRCAHLRTGIVLSPHGGALGRILDLFKLGLGGRIGPGTQWWSWITLADEVGAIRHLIDTESACGPFNLTAPNPVTNADFTVLLGKAIRRPAVLAVPKLVLRTTLGEFATVLLGSQRILPGKLERSGYVFRSPELLAAFSELLPG